MEPDEVGSSSKVCALCDQYLLDEAEVVDDDTGRAAQPDGVDVPVDLGKCRERLEGHLIAAEQVETAEHRQGSRSRRP